MSVRTLWHRSGKGLHREHASRRTPGNTPRLVRCCCCCMPSRHATLFDRLQGHAMPSKSHFRPASMNLLASRHPLGVEPCSSAMVRERLHLPLGDFEVLPSAHPFNPAINLLPPWGLSEDTRGGGDLDGYHGRSSADTLIDRSYGIIDTGARPQKRLGANTGKSGKPHRVKFSSRRAIVFCTPLEVTAAVGIPDKILPLPSHQEIGSRVVADARGWRSCTVSTVFPSTSPSCFRATTTR